MREVEVGEHVAVDHEKCLIQEAIEPPGRAGGPEKLGLDRVHKPDVKCPTVAEILDDNLGLIVQVDRDLSDPVSTKQTDGVLQQRPAVDWQHRLGSMRSQATHPSPKSGSKNQCFHSASYRHSGTPYSALRWFRTRYRHSGRPVCRSGTMPGACCIQFTVRVVEENLDCLSPSFSGALGAVTLE